MSRVCDQCSETLTGRDVFRLCTLSSLRWCTLAEQSRLVAEYAMVTRIISGHDHPDFFPRVFFLLMSIVKTMRPRLRTLIFDHGQSIGHAICCIIRHGRNYRGQNAATRFKIAVLSPLIYRIAHEWICAMPVGATICGERLISSVLCKHHALELARASQLLHIVLPGDLTIIAMEYIIEDYSALTNAA
jgi:hypothetical protein